MRHCFLFFLFSITVFAQGGGSQYTCRVGNSSGILASLAERNIVGLQMELYAWSEFKVRTSEDKANLQKLAKGVVFSLANELSASGDRFQQCSLSDDEYYRKSTEANTVVLLMRETFTSPDHWLDLFEQKRWPLKDVPPLIGHLATNPAIRGHKLPIHPVMEKVIRRYAGRGWWRQRRVDLTDPVQVAALELLGQRLDWDVEKFKLIKFFEINKENMLFNEKGGFYTSGSVEEFRSKPGSEKLAIAANYYLQQ